MNDSIQLFDKQLSIVTKPIPKVNNPDDVLVRVSYSGVCGTDIHILSGEFPCSSKAVTLGHEFCGTVQAVGSSVAHVKVGDRVVVNPNNQCRICSRCVEGDPHFCETGGIRSTVGIWKNGGWANYCRVASTLVYLLPDDIPFKSAVFIEPFSCLARGYDILGPIKPQAKVLICGAGIIGLLWTSLLHHKGHRDIVVSEIAAQRRSIISHFNIDVQVVEPELLEKQYREAKRNQNESWGFDVIIDCTGAPKAIEQAFNWLRIGATFLQFGCSPKDSKIEINPFDIYYKEVRLIGSFINPFTFPTGLALVRDMKNYLIYERLGIKTYQLQDYPAALEALKAGKISKAIFEIEIERD